jgi:hypothetical protein
LAVATRAEQAAEGLARADVAAREAEIEAQRVEIEKNRGLAAAEVAASQATTEVARVRGLEAAKIEAQERRAALYAAHPELVELDRFDRQLAHDAALAQIRADAQVKILTAIAPQLDFKVFGGDGGRMAQMLTQFATIGYGIQVVSDEVPAIGQLLGGNGAGNSLTDILAKVMPEVKAVVQGMSPRVISTMTVAQLLDELAPVISGDTSITKALLGIRNSVGFKLVADLPAKQALSLVGVSVEDDDVVAATQ